MFVCTQIIAVVLLLTLSACATTQRVDVANKPPSRPLEVYHPGQVEAEPDKDLSRPLTNIKRPTIVVYKERRKLQVFDGDVMVREYRIGLGPAPRGDKIRQGDGRTPEGTFYVCRKNGASAYGGKSLWVSYPDPRHAEEALKDGLIGKGQYESIVEAAERKSMPPMNTRLGGLVAIHGGGGIVDWTLGCVGLNDKDIAELFRVASVGTEIRINP